MMTEPKFNKQRVFTYSSYNTTMEVVDPNEEWRSAEFATKKKLIKKHSIDDIYTDDMYVHANHVKLLKKLTKPGVLDEAEKLIDIKSPRYIYDDTYFKKFMKITDCFDKEAVEKLISPSKEELLTPTAGFFAFYWDGATKTLYTEDKKKDRWGYSINSGHNVKTLSLIGTTNVSVCSRCEKMLMTSAKTHFSTSACKVIDETDELSRAGYVSYGKYVNLRGDDAVILEHGYVSASDGSKWIPAYVSVACEQYHKLVAEKSPVVVTSSEGAKDKFMKLSQWFEYLSDQSNKITSKCSISNCTSISTVSQPRIHSGFKKYMYCDKHGQQIVDLINSVNTSATTPEE